LYAKNRNMSHPGRVGWCMSQDLSCVGGAAVCEACFIRITHEKATTVLVLGFGSSATGERTISREVIEYTEENLPTVV
jgi:hypothetical protein